MALRYPYIVGMSPCFKVTGVIRFLPGAEPTRMGAQGVTHVELLYEGQHWPMAACRNAHGGRNHPPEERELVTGPPTCLWCMVAKWPWDGRDGRTRGGRWR